MTGRSGACCLARAVLRITDRRPHTFRTWHAWSIRTGALSVPPVSVQFPRRARMVRRHVARCARRVPFSGSRDRRRDCVRRDRFGLPDRVRGCSVIRPCDSLSRIETAIRDIYSMHRIAKSPHTRILETLKAQVWEPINSRTASGKRRFSAYVAGYASGVAAQCHHELHRDHLEFCYRDENGVLYSTHRASTHRRTEEFYAAGRGCELSRMPSTHVWKGSDRPFSPFELATSDTVATHE